MTGAQILANGAVSQEVKEVIQPTRRERRNGKVRTVVPGNNKVKCTTAGCDNYVTKVLLGEQEPCAKCRRAAKKVNLYKVTFEVTETKERFTLTLTGADTRFVKQMLEHGTKLVRTDQP